MLNLFSCKRSPQTLPQEFTATRPDLRDGASSERAHVATAAAPQAGEASTAALPRREPVGVYVMVDNFS